MTQESEIREKKTYTFRNEDSASRVIVVEHPVRAGYELRGSAHPAETTADWLRFRLPVEPKQTASLVVEEAHPTQASFELANLTSEQVTLFVSQHSIDPAMETAFRQILERKDAIAQLEEQKNGREEETQRIFDNQQRLRENIKALKGTPEEKSLLQRYTQQLNEEESRLEVLQKETNQLDTQIESAQAQLDAAIQKLSFDVKI
jgi:DNA repair exonuclease SbcCD ATPase subunit